MYKPKKEFSESFNLNKICRWSKKMNNSFTLYFFCAVNSKGENMLNLLFKLTVPGAYDWPLPLPVKSQINSDICAD